jgi:UPF0755 protein
MKKVIYIIAILVSVAIALLTLYTEGKLPVNKNAEKSVMFVVNKGENLDSIINKLSSEKLIRNRVVFYLVVKQLGIERKIQAGDFRLSQSMSAEEIAKELTHGAVDIWVTVREGLRKEEVAEIMSKEFDISETEFNNLSREGYLFPDTYLIPKNPSVEQIVNIMESTFNKRYSEELQKKARKNGFTDLELITFASIIEKEATANDKQEVADILFKRLRDNYPLQVDATVQYAIGYQVNEKRWWKKQTTFEDLKIESPYNTYKNVGLPPNPICSPSLASIKAAANASVDTPYMFYLHDRKGKTYYAETYDQHLENIEKYLR